MNDTHLSMLRANLLFEHMADPEITHMLKCLHPLTKDQVSLPSIDTLHTLLYEL